MKRLGLLLLFAVAAWAQSDNAAPASGGSDQDSAQAPVTSSASFPVERVQTPTYADLYCAGFVSKQLLPNANFVEGGLHTPNTTKFAKGEIVYLAGGGYQPGAKYSIVRELRDINEFEVFTGQHAAVAAAGQPYSDVAWVKILDTRSKSAIAQIEFACDAVNPGDIAIPFAERPSVSFHGPLRFDRFAPANGKTSGRIVLAKDFDTVLGTGMKVYMNVGANQGVKVGDYFRAVRTYDADLHDPVDSLSFRASTAEDTQKRPPKVEPSLMNMESGKGPTIRVRDLPRRAVGEVVIISVTPTTATGMIVFALEDVHVGDGVELDEQQH